MEIKIKEKYAMRTVEVEGISTRKDFLSVFFFHFRLLLFHCQNRAEVVQFMTKKGSIPGYTTYPA
jgi:hypothetical protein